MESLVKVELKDGTLCQVTPATLDDLIAQNKVIRFERAEGWAMVNQDPLRDKRKGTVYSIPERRH